MVKTVPFGSIYSINLGKGPSIKKFVFNANINAYTQLWG